SSCSAHLPQPLSLPTRRSSDLLLQPTADGFLRGGEPHLVISGALHYFRVHPAQWRDRLRRLVAMGCNTVETYVAWNVHQPSRERSEEHTSELQSRFDLVCLLLP